MKGEVIVGLAVALAVSLIFAGCGRATRATDTTTAATDYSVSNHWLALPASIDKEVDVFYVYPTVWQKTDDTEPTICAIDNPSMLIGSQAAYSVQATAFEPIANIYAPYYRQADAAFTFSLPTQEQRDQLVASIPKSDVFAAFDYYINNYNNGRPFMLVGHSQGSQLVTYLLSEYLRDNPSVYARMIAAYPIGFSITEEYLAGNPHLKFAQGPDDIGVIVSYNTEAPGVLVDNPVVLPGAIAINPITWTRDETVATADQNLGSIVLNEQREIVSSDEKNYADAQVNQTRGVVICSVCDVEKLAPGNGLFPRGVYHSYDYPFYYYNIGENAATRTRSFLNKR